MVIKTATQRTNQTVIINGKRIFRGITVVNMRKENWQDIAECRIGTLFYRIVRGTVNTWKNY